MNVNEYLSNWAACYKKDLIENILPFWLKNGLDRKHGGVYTCLDRDGSLMDTTKSVWFQGRFGFIAAYAYREESRMAGCFKKLYRLYRGSLFRCRRTHVF